MSTNLLLFYAQRQQRFCKSHSQSGTELLNPLDKKKDSAKIWKENAGPSVIKLVLTSRALKKVIYISIRHFVWEPIRV